jgi:hypothetical protein
MTCPCSYHDTVLPCRRLLTTIDDNPSQGMSISGDPRPPSQLEADIAARCTKTCGSRRSRVGRERGRNHRILLPSSDPTAVGPATDTRTLSAAVRVNR